MENLRPIPAEYIPVIAADKLANTVAELDAGIADILKAGQAKEAAYANKRDLIKQKVQLETEVKLAESEALMEIKGEARSQYVVIAGEKVALNNDTARDAYRRMASKELREKLAEVEGEIAAIDVDIARASDSWYSSKDANDSIRAKAHVQGSLLEFLSSR